jgi:hypothetical protein
MEISLTIMAIMDLKYKPRISMVLIQIQKPRLTSGLLSHHISRMALCNIHGPLKAQTKSKSSKQHMTIVMPRYLMVVFTQMIGMSIR